MEEITEQQFLTYIKKNGRFIIYDSWSGEMVDSNLPYSYLPTVIGTYMDTSTRSVDLNDIMVLLDPNLVKMQETTVKLVYRGIDLTDGDEPFTLEELL